MRHSMPRKRRKTRKKMATYKAMLKSELADAAGATTMVLVLKRIANGIALLWTFHKLRIADKYYNTFAYSMVPVTKDC